MVPKCTATLRQLYKTVLMAVMEITRDVPATQ